MSATLPISALTQSNLTPYLIRIDIDTLNARELARSIARNHPLRRPRLVVDCRGLRCLRTHGVAHFVSQLLLLHAGGSQVLLLNVRPALQRCLHLLGLDKVFYLSSLPVSA